MRRTLETNQIPVTLLDSREDNVEPSMSFGNGRSHTLLVLGDLFVAIMSVLFFIWLSKVNAGINLYSWLALSTVPLCPGACYIFDLYNIDRCIRPARQMLGRSLLAVLLIGLSLLALYLYFIGDFLIINAITLIVMLLWIGIVLVREIYLLFCQTPLFKKPALILGAGESGRALYDLLKLPLSPYHVKGFVDDTTATQSSSLSPGLPDILGPCDQLSQIARSTGARDAILAVPNNRSPELIRCVLKARLEGTVIREMADVYEQLTGRIPVAHIQDHWLLFARGFNLLNHPYVKHVKRILDVVGSGILLLIALPVIALVSALIRLDSHGTILYCQQRVGKDQKAFVVYKFRSMFTDAEAEGVQWASSNDPRITRLGRILRRYHIDEIPQLFNVFKGNMSLIGPRPERPEFVRLLEAQLPYYFIRHAVKPGLTGWAQVTFRYGASLQDSLRKLEADLYYIKNMSFLLDLKILLRTIGVVSLAEGSR